MIKCSNSTYRLAYDPNEHHVIEWRAAGIQPDEGDEASLFHFALVPATIMFTRNTEYPKLEGTPKDLSCSSQPLPSDPVSL